MERVNELDDPNRCKASAGATQCLNKAAEGSDYCIAHKGIDRSEANNKRAYLLAEATDRAKLARFAESESIKSLRDEIALARLMVERHWNMIKNDNDFTNRAPSINSLLLTIERLIKSSHSIEQSLKSLLGREHVIAFAQLLVQAVMDELATVPGYEKIMDRVIAKIMSTLSDDAASTVVVIPQLTSDSRSSRRE
jgi:flagellar motility protein MotE (MotC chaperone)